MRGKRGAAVRFLSACTHQVRGTLSVDQSLDTSKKEDVDFPVTPGFTDELSILTASLESEITTDISLGTPVVKMPDDIPTCPCCATRVERLRRLINHLKRAHGKRKFVFQCSCCRKTNEKYHSTSCHLPKCKGAQELTQREGFVCEECNRTFRTKIGLGQHERLAHPALRNAKRIKATRPKENSKRAA